jgi:hypothetical protein
MRVCLIYTHRRHCSLTFFDNLIHMAPNRYNFESPGAAASDALAQFLVQQQALKRQKMLDDLNAQVQAQNIAASKASTESLVAQREATEEERRLKMAGVETSTLRPGQTIGADAAMNARKMLPHLFQDTVTQGQQIGTADELGPDIPLYETAKSTQFTGTPAQIEQQRLQQEMQEFLGEDFSQNPEMKRIQDYVKAQQVTGDDSLPYQLFDQKKPELDVREVGGYLYERQPDGTWLKVAEGRAPQAGAGGDNRPYYMPQTLYDAQGRPVGVGSFNARTGELNVVQSPDGSTIKPPPASLAIESIKNEATLDSLQNLRTLFDNGAKDLIGPAEGRMRSYGQNIPGVEVNPVFANFKAATSALKNHVIRTVTGAAVGVQEEARILGEIPLETDKPEVWEAKYQQTVQNMARLEARMRTDRGSQNQPGQPAKPVEYERGPDGKLRVKQ